MENYNAPLDDIRFILQALDDSPADSMFDRELTDAILSESSKFAADVLSPLNMIGDQQGTIWSASGVTTPEGFKSAYKQFIEAEWNKVSTPEELGGQGFPELLSTAVKEIFASANKSFVMCPDLSAAAIEALVLAANDELKATYLPNLVSGKWSATMNLTEPQAGSDVGALRARAMPQDDGSYRLYGQKIFISFGEHDLTDNIVHLVLARIPGAPEGPRGISLFLVPKYLAGADNTWQTANDVVCTGIEHKVGSNASPTCTLVYGDRGEGATGWLLGEENKGLQYMFVMMNSARLKVGMESVAVSELSYQQALNYAKERVQGKSATGKPLSIIHHPDVSRMLLSMRSRIDAMRSVGYWIASLQDSLAFINDREEAKHQSGLLDLMIPIFKGWATETAVEVTATSVQVHGGIGYVTESGASQPLRDVLICPIYEGTTGIQAQDLITRKIIREGGASLKVWFNAMQQSYEALASDEDLSELAKGFAKSLDTLEKASQWVLTEYEHASSEVLASSVPFLRLAGIVAGAWQLFNMALFAKHRAAKGEVTTAFLNKKLANAKFYNAHVLSMVDGLAYTVMYGGVNTLEFVEQECA